MKKILVAVVVLAGIAAAFWWSRSDEAPRAGGAQTAASGADKPANGTGAPLSGDPDTQARAGTNDAPKPAPAANVAPDASAPAPRNAKLELPQDFIDFAPNLSRPDLLGFRDKIRANVSERAEALRAARGGAPSRSVFAETRGTDPWVVALQHVPAGYVGFAVPRGYEKENGGERFDLYLYPEDDDAEWATGLLELRWIEERLGTLPE